MEIPREIAVHLRDDYREGYRTGYRGDSWALPREVVPERAAKIIIAQGKIPIAQPLPQDHPRSKAYMAGYAAGKKRFDKLKGGVDCRV